MTQPRISLVTCSYQQGRYLDATIRSVLGQNYPNLDYIVVDGGSTDGSVDIIRRYASELSYWISEPDHGQTEALVKGFARADGDICGWLCSDDILLPNALTTVANFFNDNPHIDVVYGDCLWIDADGVPIRPKREMHFSRFVFMYDYDYLPQPSTFWRRSLYDAVGGLDPYFHMAMDSDLWERFSSRSNIAHIPEYLSCMRMYPEQKTSMASLKPRRVHEDGLVRSRASPLARIKMIRQMLRVLARTLRVLHKARAGGYTSEIPSDLMPWLDHHRTGGQLNPSSERRLP